MARTLPQLCGSISGHLGPIAFGPKMHEAGYKALGLDFRYVAAESQDLKATVTSFLELGFRGFGVAMPYKLEILDYLNEVSGDVTAIGACNTVINEDGRLTGYNTDWRGALGALSERGVEQPGRAIVLGAGGVARALIFGLLQAGWHVEVSARNQTSAAKLASDFGLPSPTDWRASSFPTFDLVVNATPVTAPSDDFPALERFPNAKAMFDVVFIPAHSPLRVAAEQRGLIVIPGWLMLLHQAFHQFTLYTGADAPVAEMREALLNALP